MLCRPAPWAVLRGLLAMSFNVGAGVTVRSEDVHAVIGSRDAVRLDDAVSLDTG